jgi:hypothetical protein
MRSYVSPTAGAAMATPCLASSRTTRVLACALCVVSRIAAPLSAGAQVAGPFTDLTLRVRASDAPVLPMEAVPLRIELSNDTPRPVLGHENILPTSRILDLYLARPQEGFRCIGLATLPIVSVSGLRLRPLRPGYFKAKTVPLWWGEFDGGPQVAFFASPGEYRVKAVLHSVVGEESIESNVVTINVVEPGPRDAAAWEFIRRRTEETQRFFFKTASIPGQGVGELEAFIEQFPDSRYTAYARYTLGCEVWHAKRLSAGAAALEKTLAEEGFPLREEVLYYLVFIYSLQGRFERAEDRLATLRAEFPESRFLPSAQQRLDEEKRRRQAEG